MKKKLYVIKGECEGRVEGMGCIRLSQEEYENYNDNEDINNLGNELLAEHFPTGYWIEEYDGDFGKKTDKELEEFYGLYTI